MTVIILSGEATSRSVQIGTAIVSCLGFEFVTQQQLELRVAERMGVDKVLINHVLAGTASWLERCIVSRRTLLRHATAETATVAARGNIVLQAPVQAAALRRVPHVFHVHLSSAPIASTEAERERSHKSELLQHLGKFDWKLRTLLRSNHHYYYSLVLNNVAVTPVAICADLVCQLAQQIRFQPTPGSRAKLTRLMGQVHPCRDRPWPSRCLRVSIGSDQVRLNAVTSAEQAIARVEEQFRSNCDGRRPPDWLSLPPPII